jgi:hypothetical protein
MRLNVGPIFDSLNLKKLLFRLFMKHRRRRGTTMVPSVAVIMDAGLKMRSLGPLILKQPNSGWQCNAGSLENLPAPTLDLASNDMMWSSNNGHFC